MTPKNSKTIVADTHIVRQRLEKARGFFLNAEESETLDHDRNSVASSYIHAGIAAADVICGKLLGEYSIAADHSEAVTLLKKADPSAATLLSTLISNKTRSNYGYDSINEQNFTRVKRAAGKLLERAEEL